MQIQDNYIPTVYIAAKNVYEKKMTLSEGKSWVHHSVGMNPNSAADFINNFKCLLEGKKYIRALNAFSVKYFLENILKDYGHTKLFLALSALKQHIEYFETERKKKVNLHKLRAIYESYIQTTSPLNLNELEQFEIISQLKESVVSKEQLLSELINLKETDSEVVFFKGKSYKRDNKTVAQIKILRDFKCQFCGTTIIKKDGSKYIEAAHIKAKHEKGCETLDNIILLCPNHHKEFDLGNRITNICTKQLYDVTLNGKNFIIEFEKLNNQN
jgi:5-methylcytosine-specific restriction enzyme A